MTPKDAELALLPSGFVDLLPPEAEQEAKAIAILMKHYAGYGYQLVKTPMVEFEDSLLAPGPGAALAKETFRLMDPISHRMMGVRSDMTPQIARIAAVRLKEEGRPLRLSYAGSVLRTKGHQQRPERQFAQVGCELIGASSADAEVESCVLAVQGLKKLGLSDITIDLCLPQLVDLVLGGVPDDDLLKALEQRSQDGLKDAPQAIKDLLAASGEGEKALAALEKIDLPKEAQEPIAKLKTIYEGVVAALKDLGIDDVSVTIDPIERFGYQSQFGFTLFAKNVRGELGRGGRYDVRFGDDENTETACGFTIYMDSVRRALPAEASKDVVEVEVGESWAEISKLQSSGKTVIRTVK